jgi:hypothetical protein
VLKRSLLVGICAAGLTIGPAGALIDTRTNARVCRNEPCHVETFSGGYFIKGSVNPSKPGQKVKFDYKRRGTHNWHSFGRGEDSNKVFVSTDGTPSDRLNERDRFREHFDIGGGFPHRNWVLRARFIRQDGYAGSGHRVPVRIAFGD